MLLTQVVAITLLSEQDYHGLIEITMVSGNPILILHTDKTYLNASNQKFQLFSTFSAPNI